MHGGSGAALVNLGYSGPWAGALCGPMAFRRSGPFSRTVQSNTTDGKKYTQIPHRGRADAVTDEGFVGDGRRESCSTQIKEDN